MEPDAQERLGRSSLAGRHPPSHPRSSLHSDLCQPVSGRNRKFLRLSVSQKSGGPPSSGRPEGHGFPSNRQDGQILLPASREGTPDELPFDRLTGLPRMEACSPWYVIADGAGDTRDGLKRRHQQVPLIHPAPHDGTRRSISNPWIHPSEPDPSSLLFRGVALVPFLRVDHLGGKSVAQFRAKVDTTYCRIDRIRLIPTRLA